MNFQKNEKKQTSVLGRTLKKGSKKMGSKRSSRKMGSKRSPKKMCSKKMGSKRTSKKMGSKRTSKKMGSKRTSKKMGSKRTSKKMGSKRTSKKMGSKKMGSKRTSKKMGSKRTSKKMGSKKGSNSYYAERMIKEHPGYVVAERSKKWSKKGKAKASRKVLPVVGSDISLAEYGYSLQNKPKERKASLKRASKNNNTLAILRRVNLIRNYSKSVPVNYEKLSQDVEFLKKEYKKEKNTV